MTAVYHRTGNDDFSYARFETIEFDADNVYGKPEAEGVTVIPPGKELVTPPCTPTMAARIARPEDLYDHPLIRSDNKQIRWPAWFEANGLAPPSRMVRNGCCANSITRSDTRGLDASVHPL